MKTPCLIWQQRERRTSVYHQNCQAIPSPYLLRAKELGLTTEVQVFGRVSLALSARCYRARAHGRIKDNCQFICEEDPDGMPLNTLDKEEFLTVNGIQTLSHSYLNLLGEMEEMKEMGVTHFRLVPHTQDMVAVANIFRDALDNTVYTQEASINLAVLDVSAPFSNGLMELSESKCQEYPFGHFSEYRQY